MGRAAPAAPPLTFHLGLLNMAFRPFVLPIIHSKEYFFQNWADVSPNRYSVKHLGLAIAPSHVL
jgi:hypothetical protein